MNLLLLIVGSKQLRIYNLSAQTIATVAAITAAKQ
jgi:hypothetical protein